MHACMVHKSIQYVCSVVYECANVGLSILCVGSAVGVAESNKGECVRFGTALG